MASITLWRDLIVLTRQARRQFKLHVPVIFEPIVNGKDYGVCFAGIDHDDKLAGKRAAVIRIRVHRESKPDQPRTRREIIDTLAHELAHLRHARHTPEWRNLYHRIARSFGLSPRKGGK